MGGARAPLARALVFVEKRESEEEAGVSSGGMLTWPTKVPRGECSRMESVSLAEVMECVVLVMRTRALNKIAISIIGY